jgi:hypothetical protein
MFADLAPAMQPAHAFLVALGVDGSYSVQADGAPAVDYLARGEVLGTLVWLVNQGVTENPGDLLLFHAAAVAAGEVGVLVPAPSGSGKSTLAGGLVASGLCYLSDEVGALDTAAMRALAYPKPLSLATGSLVALCDLGLQVQPDVSGWMSSEYQLPSAAIRLGSVVGSCPVGLVLFPELALGRQSVLDRLRPSEALGRLVVNTFNLADQPDKHLQACAELCRTAESYRLVIGDLATACSLVLSLLGVSAPGDALLAAEAR